MTGPAAPGVVSHDLDFTQPAPMGFALCRRCGGYFTIEQWVEWRCPGGPGETSAAPRPAPRGGLRCALCGAPVMVDPLHRAIVEWFGATRDRCFELAMVPASV